MLHIIRPLVVVFLLSVAVIGQCAEVNKLSEDAEKLRKDAVVFLRETLADVNAMRSLENRISFTAEIAGLMWFHDEREARGMYVGAINDYRDLLIRYDAQMTALGVTPDDRDSRGGPMSFMIDPSDKARVLRKYTTAVGVGQQIAMSLAEHDPELAYSFYYDSFSIISNPEFRKQSDTGGIYFESQLLNQIAENNAAKASQLAARSLNKGVTFQHVELLKKIYKKDPEKGSELATAIFGRVKSEKLDNTDFYWLSSLLEFGSETLDESRKPGGKRAIYSMTELRDIADLFGQAILSYSESEGPSGLGYVEIIQKYSPGRAAQIRTKFRRSMPSSGFNAAANAMNAAANAAYGYGIGISNSSSNSNSARYEREIREREQQEKDERQMAADIKSLGNKTLPREERERIVAAARKIIATTPGRHQKIVGLSMLASSVSKAGDKELASEIMRDAERLVNPSPKNYQDFLLSWLLASGYAEADPEKAFPLLEETIGRANETLEAFIKVGEFVDVAEEIILDGEVQVGAFGGQMVRGLTRELGMADRTIEVLAKADFMKTKHLTNRFDRAEIRVLAKMMVLRAVLNPKKALNPEEILDRVLTEEIVDN